jgi:hypothetical protein
LQETEGKDTQVDQQELTNVKHDRD